MPAEINNQASNEQALILKMLQFGDFELKITDIGQPLNALVQFLGLAFAESALAELVLKELSMNGLIYSVGIDSAKKTLLFHSNTWSTAFQEQGNLSQNKNKVVKLKILRQNESTIKVIITDMGPGFDLSEWVKNLKDRPSLEQRGRGLMLANKICENLKSKILKNKEGQVLGTEIEFTMPASNAKNLLNLPKPNKLK